MEATQVNSGFAFRDDRGDGLDLRTVTYAGQRVASRLYFALRDDWWRTVPLEIRDSRRQLSAHGAVHEIDAVGRWPSHPFEVTVRYVVDGAELTAEFAATARGSFTYRRVGFCVLFGADEFRGRPATSWRAGEATPFDFPARIVTRDHLDPASVRFHRPFNRLDTTLEPGIRVRYRFEGDEFEFEDQRNWTDASYKAYSVPPPDRGPLSTKDGERFVQRIRIRVDPAGEVVFGTATAGAGDDRSIRLGARIGEVPSIGLYERRLSSHSYRPAGGFQEWNAQRPDAARLSVHDSIELGVNGAVHAADDDSVLEATALHGALVAQVRAAHPDLPVGLAPVTFLDTPGDWRDEAGDYLAAPPPGPAPGRRAEEFAATWVIASAARAVPEGPQALRYFDASLPAACPAARTVARLAGLRGRPVLAVEAPPPLAALAVEVDGAVVLAVANPSPDPARFRLPDGREASLPGFASHWFEAPWPPASR
ncbi:hypothetical protein GCM10023322_55440 [Rugosimonospora acidiphila]|uniref:Uncharacterized protein n=1 Tax=Rugosimonospora acidiphila TaxID=556531 RepID=A0ABP9SAF4_9ACTN